MLHLLHSVGHTFTDDHSMMIVKTKYLEHFKWKYEYFQFKIPEVLQQPIINNKIDSITVYKSKFNTVMHLISKDKTLILPINNATQQIIDCSFA